MTHSQVRRGPAGSRMLLYIGLSALVVRVLAGEPLIALLGCPLGIVDLYGLLAADRERQ
ncbi:hypothetical protein [Streptomyces sp. SPB162]|uniref:hypothetical protein n=1 Tax=Streptomyces sp. SPB162 TaxID=2940560 RepID=UPI0024053234|nr:hypothetical protein [Streptomyces sp. SPB162]MDF9817084.1 hypothetical protein [Streptomyces sp. SPB162]